jgi:hypothetical protein
LLGDLIDDPLRKKDCYSQVLRLSPGNLQALTRLRELDEPPPGPEPIPSPEAAPKTAQNSPDGLRQSSRFEDHSQSDSDNTGYIIGGIIAGGMLVGLIVLFLIGNASDPSSGINPLYGILILLLIIGGIFLWASNQRNR